jgi:hypothetical protein
MKNRHHWITRHQYNQLMRSYPNWMKEEWPNVQRIWRLTGILIRSHIEIVKQMLETIDTIESTVT